jgi:D-alanine-D-alanine ligase
MGGKSAEREVSLRSGNRILASLQHLGMDAVAIDARDGFVDELRNQHVQVVFNALHGGAGESGALQGFLETEGLPYTGSGVLSCALTLNKIFTKQALLTAGIPTPDYLVAQPEDDLETFCRQVESTLGLPVVTKPVSEGSSIGVSFAHSPAELRKYILHLVKEYGCALIEKMIEGPEVTVGILGFGHTLRALPVLLLVTEKEFYDYDAKYTKGLTQLIAPAPLPEDVSRGVQEIALKAHQALGCHGISRVDIRLDKNHTPFVLDINTMPGMTELSDVPAEAAAAGISYDDLVLEILFSALPRMEGECP